MASQLAQVKAQDGFYQNRPWQRKQDYIKILHSKQIALHHAKTEDDLPSRNSNSHQASRNDLQIEGANDKIEVETAQDTDSDASSDSTVDEFTSQIST